jgi:hypothetical protein
MQEEVYSHRLLYFSGHLIDFRSKMGTYNDIMTLLRQQVHNNSLGVSRAHLVSSIFDGGYY